MYPELKRYVVFKVVQCRSLPMTWFQFGLETRTQQSCIILCLTRDNCEQAFVLCIDTKGRADFFFHLSTTTQILPAKKKMMKFKRISPKKLTI